MSFDPVFSALWRFGNAATDIAPTAGTWNWNELDLTVTELTVADIDKDGIDRTAMLAGVVAGDRLHLRNTSTADNWAMFDITAITAEVTWALVEVALVGLGTVPGLPAFRQLVLLDFLRPVLSTVGPISVRFDEIVARVAANLHVDPDDVWVGSAVDAAIEYTLIKTERFDVGLDDSELNINGLVGFSTRLYMDSFSPTGANVAVGDPNFEPIFSPEKLDKHWREYFLNSKVLWGVA
jgi:hypothetical protein